MKKYRFLCLDDNVDEVQRATARLGEAVDALEIETRAPLEFKKQVSDISKRRRDKKLDGLILDLRLDQNAPAGSKTVDYKAQLLATGLRTRMAASTLRDFPVVLWSISQKLARSYDKDITSHDLFDLVFDKDDLHSKQEIKLAADQLVSLSKGYESITSQSGTAIRWDRLLRAPSEAFIDSRLSGSLDRTLPVHVIARFILKKLVEHPGVLIDESILCARLGITVSSFHSSDIEKDLRRFSYKGPFSEGWPRWWWSAIENWWRRLDADVAPLLSFNAEERVKQLKDAGYQKLQPAIGIAKGYSTRFTTVCQKLRRPLDVVDGFALSGRKLEPWQERLYVSAEVATKPGRYLFDGEFDPLEAERLKQARASVTRAKTKHGR
jgi:hypothetical protein